jgi:cell division protein FtsN
MDGEKKFKFEVSKLGLVFIVLFALCLLVWTFILGVWIGTKIGEKPQQAETVKLEPQPAQTPQVPAVKEVAHSENQTNQTQVENQTASQQVASQVQPEEKTKPEAKVEKEKPKPEPKTEKAKAEPVKTAKVHPQEKVKPQPHQEGMPFYALQVGAYSKRESAEKVKAEVEKMGFKALIKESTQDGKTVYKVLAGRFENREKAEQYKTKIESTLGVKPFVVEVK